MKTKNDKKKQKKQKKQKHTKTQKHKNTKTKVDLVAWANREMDQLKKKLKHYKKMVEQLQSQSGEGVAIGAT